MRKLRKDLFQEIEDADEDADEDESYTFILKLPYYNLSRDWNEFKGMTGCQAFRIDRLKKRNRWDECRVSPANMGAYTVSLESLDWMGLHESSKVFTVTKEGKAYLMTCYQD